MQAYCSALFYIRSLSRAQKKLEPNKVAVTKAAISDSGVPGFTVSVPVVAMNWKLASNVASSLTSKRIMELLAQLPCTVNLRSSIVHPKLIACATRERW